jgi:RNA binding activity-knot of a chromodomain
MFKLRTCQLCHFSYYTYVHRFVMIATVRSFVRMLDQTYLTFTVVNARVQNMVSSERFKVDTIHAVKWRNGLYRARIIDVRTLNDQLECYVHYISFDRRLDEWISFSLIDEEELQEEMDPEEWSKRKLNEMDSTLSLTELPIDNLEKERQEFTKVVSGC